MQLCPFCKFPLHRNVSEFDEDAIYAEVLSELKSGTVRPGLWAKAFAESEGDENKSQALYITLRVQQERERRQQEQQAASALAAESPRRKEEVVAKKKLFRSWKSFVAAIIMAFMINIFDNAASGGRPVKNMWWTVMWIYFSIEAWKYWRWKVLLPYPLFALVSVLLGLMMVGNNVDKMSWAYILVKGTLNIGGLVIFYLLLRKSEKAALHQQV